MSRCNFRWPSAAFLALAAVTVVPFMTGCAEEEAEAREAAYPVGVTLPPSSGPAAPPEVAEDYAPPPPAEQSAPASPEVVVGDDAPSPQPGDAPGQDDAEDTSPSALTDFRPALDPYGTWVDDPNYGTVWVPSPTVVGEDFTPYQSAGHWAYDGDYVWVSDYDWGWAPFHYGRWAYGRGVGWEWVPGRRYAGAWVSWRYGLNEWGYVGWAPLPPTWCWHRGVAVGLGYVPVAPYAFVAARDLFSPRIGSRVIAGQRVGIIAAHTSPWVPGAGGASAVGGHVVARPSVGGPPPSALHIPQSAVVQAGGNRGAMQAQAFARAGAGGMAASANTTGVRFYGASGAMASRPMGAAYGPPAPSHFGGKLGTGFRGSALSAAPPRASYSASARPYFASPAYGGGAQVAPALRSFGGGSAGGFRAGYAGSVPSGGFRSSGGVTGFHSSGSGGGGFHASGGGAVRAGGGGGFRGGGGGRGGGRR